MDIIFIRELSIMTTIGVHPWERAVQQTVILDLALGTDIRAAAISDCLTDTLDYAAIAARIQQFAAACTFQLVETLGEQIAALLKEEFHVRWLQLTLCKPHAVPTARGVGIIIERGLREHHPASLSNRLP